MSASFRRPAKKPYSRLGCARNELLGVLIAERQWSICTGLTKTSRSFAPVVATNLRISLCTCCQPSLLSYCGKISCVQEINRLGFRASDLCVVESVTRDGETICNPSAASNLDWLCARAFGVCNVLQTGCLPRVEQSCRPNGAAKVLDFVSLKTKSTDNPPWGKTIEKTTLRALSSCPFTQPPT